MRGLTVKRWILLAAAVSALVGWVASTASARTLHYEVTVSVTGPGRVTATMATAAPSTALETVPR